MLTWFKCVQIKCCENSNECLKSRTVKQCNINLLFYNTLLLSNSNEYNLAQVFENKNTSIIDYDKIYINFNNDYNLIYINFNNDYIKL